MSNMSKPCSTLNQLSQLYLYSTRGLQLPSAVVGAARAFPESTMLFCLVCAIASFLCVSGRHCMLKLVPMCLAA